MMRIKYNKQKFSWLIMLAAFSGILTAQETTNDSVLYETGTVNLFFNEMTKDRLSGSVNNIDAEAEFARDSRSDIGSAINGKVPGVFDNYNTWGTGNAVIVVDGVPQSSFYYQNLNLMEVESIVVLKDAMSKAIYGAMGDQGVILVNTKRGKAGSNRIRVSVQQSVMQARALPNYLPAAEYMEKYNEALVNDGLSPIYSQDSIDMTRSGESPALYPDNDFYTEDYLRNFRSNTNIIFDMSGGNENARYYVNTEWSRDNGWLNSAIPDLTNYFNFRGNLDFKINKYMKMGINAVARMSANERPNVTMATGEDSYWDKFANILPNAYPTLWDPNLITDPDVRDLVLKEAVLHNGMVLGGNSSYANNQIQGELIQNGRVKYQQSIVQFSGDLDVDLSFITKGLSMAGFAAMNFYNTLYSEQSYEYAIYEPLANMSGAIDSVSMHGTDIPRDQYNTNNDESTFNRQLTYSFNLAYDRVFGNHAVTALALVYGNQLTTENDFQKQVVFHTGLSLNYMYGKRYLIEGALMGIGSRKLPKGENMEMAPSVGVGWIISEEAFMENVSFINFLKLRASYGISKNDNWGTGNSAYYRYTSTFTRGGSFNYDNGTYANNETAYSTVQNNIYLQEREDITAGIEAVLLNNALHLQLGYFQSHSIGNLTEMNYLYPQILGFENLVYSNFNSDLTKGIELGLAYTYRASEDFSATLGGNLLNINPTITKREEPVYEGVDEALTREGTATDAMWAFVADGLYGEGDFNPDGSLVEGFPEPSFGTVQPGDIKYLDQNGDMSIDQLDQRIVGHGIRTQYSAYLDIRYKNFGLYVLGIGRLGDSNTRNENDGDGVKEGYFQVQGNVKYSEYARTAYGPGNKDVNALHPRLTSTSGGNNDRNSSFWVYENNSFTLPTIQLTYYFKGKKALSFLKESQVYVRGGNLIVTGKNKAYTEVNPYSAPKTKSFVIGIITSF
ncbi:MAG: SusC/RagA family TonB-linked outer membrane protein [Bacteroides sp.]|nr:SusC/RagA family TonB-linked outer membrane protein [Bacteroides sp.]